VRPLGGIALRAGAACCVLFAVFRSAPAHAHGFAVRYDLPLPLGYFLAGAGATVLLSFVLLAVLPRQYAAHGTLSTPERELTELSRITANAWLTVTLQSISVALFLLVIAAALFGDTNPFKNIATTMVWLIWWVGMMFINTFIGDLWAVVNPWNAMFAAAERLLLKLKPGARLSLERPYPPRLEVWPALVLFLVFAWIEIISGEGEDVRKLGAFIIAYSLITWCGMAVFGRRTWLLHGEAFTVVFSTFSRFAPIAFNGRRLVLRPPGAGLLVQKPVSWSTAAIVLVLLGTVTFDGFIATPTWTALYEAFTAAAKTWPGIGFIFNFYVLATAVFLLFPVLFGAVLFACCRLTVHLAAQRAAGETVRYFVLTLLPIAIAYHVAHYLVFFLLSGQYIIPAVSDPFGFGWDLFGTAFYKPDVGLIGARFAWYASVIAIVAGHVIAVQLAHRMAIYLFGGGRRMLASQCPLLTLMVVYTMLSLWIIAQPTVS
jgi:hypothetical protein